MVTHDGLTIVNALRLFRQRAGLAQGELARQAGTTRQTIGALEAGSYAPTLAVALRIARVLGCQVSDLFWLAPEAAANCGDMPRQDERAIEAPHSSVRNGAHAITVLTSQWSVVTTGNGNGANHGGSHFGIEREERPTEQIEPQYRNQFQGTIATIDRTGLVAEVVVEIGGQQLVAAIPRRTAEALGLRSGMGVIAVVKSVDIVIDPAS